jgi:hypothetical protein
LLDVLVEFFTLLPPSSSSPPHPHPHPASLLPLVFVVVAATTMEDKDIQEKSPVTWS